MRPLFATLTLAALLGCPTGCQRTPEPGPAPTIVEDRPPALQTAQPLAPPKRCLVPTPAVAPPPAAMAPRERCPKDPEPGVPALPLVSLTLPEAVSGPVKVQAELASAPKETERGLMYRMKMDEDRGMLFALHERREHPFWMRNTCIPLDMLWLDDDGFIVGIQENVPTLNDEERTVACPSSWVLEVNAGWSRRHGVRAGQKLTLPPH